MANIRLNLIEILIAIGVLTLLLFSTDPEIYPDSNRYLTGYIYDPPIYPTLIAIMQSIFGSLNSVIIFQTLLIGFSIIYFIRTVAIQFNLDFITKIIISIFLFLPIVQFYRHLLTEPICYAFSLLFVSFVFRLIFNFNYQNLIWSSCFVVFLLLTRNQFMFLYPVILILFICILILNNSKGKSWFIISFISIFLIHNTLINLSKNIKQNSFEKTTLSKNNTGVFFFTYIDAIYISSIEDVELFENKKLKNTLTNIFNEMDERKALMKYYNGRGHFGLSLKDIRNYSKPLLENISNKENDVSNIKRNISIKLIKQNFGKYVKHIFKKFYDSTWLFVFVPFLLLIAGSVSFLKYKSHISLLTIFISSFALGNHSVIYLFGRVQPRYFIYSDFILLVFIFIIFIILLSKKVENLFR